MVFSYTFFNTLFCNIVCIHSNITLDEIHGIIYSQNELNNGYLTTIQLVIILGYLIYRKTFTLSIVYFLLTYQVEGCERIIQFASIYYR